MRKQWNTEVYLMDKRDDRDYFVDKYMADPIGLCEEFGITLSERPIIPVAQMRYDSEIIPGKLGDHSSEDNYDNVEIELNFNYTSDSNARKTYGAVSNLLSRMAEGTRLRFSDDNDGSYRELAHPPTIEPLNNDLYGWGDFQIMFTLKPFRYIEGREMSLTNNEEIRIEQPLPNAKKTPQQVMHQLRKGVNIETFKNNKKIYTIDTASSNASKIATDAEILSTYGGD